MQVEESLLWMFTNEKLKWVPRPLGWSFAKGSSALSGLPWLQLPENRLAILHNRSRHPYPASSGSLRWSQPWPPATMIDGPVSPSSCEHRSRWAACWGVSVCFPAQLIQTRFTHPMGLGSNSQGARVRGQASRTRTGLALLGLCCDGDGCQSFLELLVCPFPHHDTMGIESITRAL